MCSFCPAVLSRSLNRCILFNIDLPLTVSGCLPSVYVVGNMDFQSAAQPLQSILETLHEARQYLMHLWQLRKTKLEQYMQLRMYEGEVEKVSWLND